MYYSNESRGHISTATIRTQVALTSGKFYLDEGNQEDAEEFLCALEETLSEELVALCSGIKQLSMCTQNVNRGLPTLKLEGSTSYRNCCQTIFPHREEAQYHHCQLQLPSPRQKNIPKVCVDNNLQMLPENLLMTDHFKRQEHTNQK